MRYAGFWKRFAASLIDGIIIMIAGAIVTFFFSFVMLSSEQLNTPYAADTYGNLITFILGWLYCAIMESSPRQGTIGKIAIGIKVTDLFGNRISFGKATGRHFSRLLSLMSFYIGFLMIVFTQRKQGLHDMIAGCLVVNRE